MSKNLSRDAQILLRICKYQENIKGVINDFRCDFTQQPNSSLAYNKYAFDLCALYMAQIGESVKLLTEDTKKELSKVINLDILRYFRNVIDHDYENVNKVLLQAYVQNIISREFVDAVKIRYKYCIEHKILDSNIIQ